jgi:hypothetical protein
MLLGAAHNRQHCRNSSHGMGLFTGTGVNDSLRCVQLTSLDIGMPLLSLHLFSLFCCPVLARHLLVSESFERHWKTLFLKDKDNIN